MLTQNVQRDGPGVLVEKITRRLRPRASAAASDLPPGQDPAQASSFQSRRIGDAFLRALARYQVPKVPVHVAVFRPKLDVRYRLSGGRMVDSYRNYVREDNFWTPHAGELQVFEVPGNHDNMVLEPNVRVLVSQLRRVIDSVGKE